MSLTIKFKTFEEKPSPADTCFLLIPEGTKPDTLYKNLKLDSKKLVDAALKKSKSFKGKREQTLAVQTPDSKQFDQVVCFGVGKPKDITKADAEHLGGHVFMALKNNQAAKALVCCFEGVNKDVSCAEFSAGIATGLQLRSYTFERYKTVKPKKGDEKVELSSVTLSCSKAKDAAKLYTDYDKAAQGVFLARDLVNMPPNDLYPDAYAKLIKKELEPLGVKVEVLDEKKMEKLGMKAALAVGMGSSRKPRMVIMHWPGKGKAKDKPLAFVGKGVTFDTGGISIKPSAAMDEMKMDMGGSAAVVGAVKALALLKTKTPVVGIVGLAENMPSGEAYRPGDIIGSYAGKTIEVLNTDAEGRLVLVDALAYVQDKFDPKAIVDLATLTGAMMVALGHEYCGTFVNKDAFWKKIEQAAENGNEKVWRMPLDPAWKKDMVSDFADYRNLGKTGRLAGACTAAGFLEHFIDEGRTWAHMDIAGTAWVKSDQPTVPKFGTGFGVRTLVELAQKF